MSTEYDPENIFAKIIDGTVPCFKVFESKATVAFLDAFPMVDGHTLVVPKLKGYTQFIDMPPLKASEFLRDLQTVAKAVKEAVGASGVNIWQNNGRDAGQEVFHPHFHVVPRFENDKLMQYPKSASSMISADAATPIMKKIEGVLNPPVTLTKPKFVKMSSVKPWTVGANLKVRVTEDLKPVAGKAETFYEVVCGDSSGTGLFSLRENQTSVVKKGKTICVRNCQVKMMREEGSKSGHHHMVIVVGKWGKIEEAIDEDGVEANVVPSKNISALVYEPEAQPQHVRSWY